MCIRDRSTTSRRESGIVILYVPQEFCSSYAAPLIDRPNIIIMKAIEGTPAIVPIPTATQIPMNAMVNISCLRYCPNTTSSILSMRIIVHRRLSGPIRADATPRP